MNRPAAIGFCAIACGFAAAASQQDKPAAANLAHIIRQLSDEARKSRTEGGLLRNAANFASDLKESDPPPTQQVVEKIARRIDSDAFTDAYVRWQLTSFNPALDAEKMSDREFERLVQSLPPMLENPRAGQPLLESLQKASGLGTLSEAQQAQINDKLNTIAAEASRAGAFNVPNVRFREWIVRQFQSQPHRSLTLLLDHARATAEAGWPAEEAKAAVDTALERLTRQREFTPEQRREFALACERSMIRTRMFLVSAGVNEGALAVNYGTTGILDYDVRRWIKAVTDER